MGVASGGVFRTTDGGANWVPITDGKVPLDVNLLNNERSVERARGPVLTFGGRILGWAQLLFSLVGL